MAKGGEGGRGKEREGDKGIEEWRREERKSRHIGKREREAAKES